MNRRAAPKVHTVARQRAGFPIRRRAAPKVHTAARRAEVAE